LDVLILAAEPGADLPVKTTVYGPMTPPRPPSSRPPERVALYLVRLLAGVLAGGAAMLATARWTRVDTGMIRDTFLAVLAAILTLVAAAAGFYYGTGAHRDSSTVD
jgi:hypothetical protein